MTASRDAALRPLHDAWDARSLLREAAAPPDALRGAALRVAEAADQSLRRLLRDDPAQPLDLRLRAEARDELPTADVLTALRQHDRISIQLAAAVHDLIATRTRLQQGAEPGRPEIQLVLGVAERIERELYAMRLPAAGPSTAESAEPAPRGSADGEPRGRDADRPPGWHWPAIAAAVLLLVVLGVALTLRGGRNARMDEAIALFRTGDMARAAAQFERHAEARPRDPTPRLYLARIHRRAGEFDAAAEQLRLALDAAPDDAALHRELGLLLLDLGRSEAAVGRFRTAVELDPAADEGWLGLVRALQEDGQREAADRVLARAPESARRRAGRAAPPAPR